MVTMQKTHSPCSSAASPARPASEKRAGKQRQQQAKRGLNSPSGKAFQSSPSGKGKAFQNSPSGKGKAPQSNRASPSALEFQPFKLLAGEGGSAKKRPQPKQPQPLQPLLSSSLPAQSQMMMMRTPPRRGPRRDSSGSSSPRSSASQSPRIFAGPKCFEPPTPQSLPRPPTKWTGNKAAEGDLAACFQSISMMSPSQVNIRANPAFDLAWEEEQQRNADASAIELGQSLMSLLKVQA